MRDWIDSPVSNYRQRIEVEFWCQKCKERYTRVLRFENDVGEYSGDESCPLCGHDGVLASEREASGIE